VRICFLCTGNICRSPYAEGLLRHHAMSREAQEGWGTRLSVLSAGLLDLGPRPAHPRILALAEARGFSVADHRAQPVSAVDLATVDIVLGMAPEHVEHVRALVPERAGDAYLLTAYPALGLDSPTIPDPMGQPEEAFVNSCRSIEQAVDCLVQTLRQAHRQSLLPSGRLPGRGGRTRPQGSS